MTDDRDNSLHTDEPIASYFAIENHLLGTRTADLYKAIDLSSNQPFCLWLFKQALPLNSDAVEAFLERVALFEQIEPTVADLLSFGVDSSGVPFAVFPNLDGQVISDGNLEAAEVERRLISALHLLVRVHQAGLVLGDICSSSFWLDRQGSIKLVGVMGEGGIELGLNSAPPRDTLSYLAPEQAEGLATTESDVFAFGVLICSLCFQQYPFLIPEGEQVPDYHNSRLGQLLEKGVKLPLWVETVLGQCLALDPKDRFRDAEALLQGITVARQKELEGRQMPAQQQKTVSPDQHSLIKTSIQAADQAAEGTAGKPLRPAVAFLALIAGVVVAFLFLRLATSGDQSARSGVSREMEMHQAALSDERLKEAIDVLGKSQTSLVQKAGRFEHLARSDDPVAHDVLVESALSASHPDERRLAERAILDRARRLGLVRTAEQAQIWLNTVRGNELPSSYAQVLRALNATLPGAAQVASIRQVAKSNIRMAKILAAALILDLGSQHDYCALLAEFVGLALKEQEIEKYSALAMILADPELALAFGTDVIGRKEDLTKDDIVWLMRLLAERDDLHTRAIVGIATERGVLLPLRNSYLSVVRDRPDLPPEVTRTIIRAASGALSLDDIGILGRWYDLASETVLLAICADRVDPDIQRATFDSLAAKSISVEPTRSLVDWVRSNYWEERVEFVPLIGVLANLDKLSLDQVEEGLAVLKRFTKDGRLIDILLESEDSVVAKSILENYHDLLGIGRVLNLLGHSDKEVRIAAIGRLAGINNLGVAKIVLDYYETEKEPEVRQLYAETFWFVQRRLSGTSE